MSGFIADNSSYNISTDYSMSVILSHFNTDYIYSSIKNQIDMKYIEPLPMINNIVYGYNENFKQLLFTYTNELDRQQILNTRNSIYTEIIDLLCKEFKLEFNKTEEDGQDLYNPAFYMFKLLVSEFSENVKTFFTNFIIKERNSIYTNLDLAQYKREKDSSTIYNKKRIKNSKLAIIISRLNYVIDNICVYDIPFETFLYYICEDKNMYAYLVNMIQPKVDFFKTFVVPMFNPESPVRPMLISDITISLYNQLSTEANIGDYIDEDE